MKLLLSFLFALLAGLQAFAAPALSEKFLIFHTNCGDMAVALYPEAAPRHTDQIFKLARLGILDGARFFRIEPGFVAQIENVDTRQPKLPQHQLDAVIKIPAEFNEIAHRRGILSMARFDDINSAESSFSFLLGDAPHLDRNYTVFGEVIRNIDVLNEIEKSVPGKREARIEKVEFVTKEQLDKMTLVSAHPPDAPANQIYFVILATLLVGYAVYVSVMAVWHAQKSLK